MAALLEAELPEGRGRGKLVHGRGGAADGRRPRAGGLRPARRRSPTPTRRPLSSAAARWRRCSACRMFSPRLVRAAGVGDRLAAGAPARPDRPPGARERGAQAGPHGCHGRSADDRAGGRGVRDGLRGRHQRVGRQRDRPQLPGRHRPPEHRRLLADQLGRRPRGGERPGREDGLVAELRRGRLQGQGHPRVGGRPVDRERRAVARLEEGLAEHALVALGRRRGAGRRLGEEQRHRRRRPDPGPDRVRASADAPGRGHRQGQRRPARQRWS